MDLSKIPAKLPEEAIDEWKTWILHYTGCESTKELAGILAEDISAAASSIRPELSNLLNGHTHVVARWVGDDPSEKGEALAEALNETPKSLQTRFVDLIPMPGKHRLDEKVLHYIPIHVESSRDRSVIAPLQRWLNNRNQDDLLPELDDEESLSWEELSDHLREIDDALVELDDVPTVPVFADCSRQSMFSRMQGADPILTLRLGQRQLERLCSQTTIFTTAGSEEISGENVVNLKITFEPLSNQRLDEWVEKLRTRGYIDVDTEGRARQFFAKVPSATIEKFASEHLLYAIEEAEVERLESRPADIRRRRISWLRRDLRNDANPLADEWLRNTRDFFRRWIETAEMLHGDISREELDDVLGLKAASDEELSHRQLQDQLEHCVLTEREEFDNLKQRITKLLPESLKLAIEESELLQKSEKSGKTDYLIAPRLRRLGSLELPLYVSPDDLETLDVNASTRLVFDAVRLAAPDTLNDWCRAALDVEAIDQPWAMLAVLEGLAERNLSLQQVDPQVVTTLWASCLWAILFQLNYYNDGPIHDGNRDRSQTVSRQLREVLPILPGEDDVINELEAYVDERILKAVQRWNTPDSQINRDELGRQLVALAPFQLGLDDIERLNPERQHLSLQLRRSDKIELHLANRGDMGARRAILEGTSANACTAREKVDPSQLLVWWNQLARTGSMSSDDVSDCFRSDFHNVFVNFINEKNDSLRTLLDKTLKNESLREALSQHHYAISAIESGPVEIIKWLLHREEPFLGRLNFYERRENGPSRADTLLAIIELLELPDVLRGIVNIEISELPSSTHDGLLSASVATLDDRTEPELTFSRLHKFARFRHRSLLLLAALGDAAPLRRSLKNLWEVDSPYIAQQRTRWFALKKRINPLSTPNELPELSDEVLAAVVRSLVGESPEELRERFPTQWKWTIPTQSHELDIYLLALESAPPARRWQLLAPFARRLWDNRHNEKLRPFWNTIDEIAKSVTAGGEWYEPRNLRDERQKWARIHDDKTIRKLCNEELDPHSLLQDLDGRGEAAWPHLDREQRHQLLSRLPKEAVDDTWWSRGQDLPLKQRLRFARKHGTLTDRRQIARDLLGAASDDPTSRLWVWLYSLRKDERPSIEAVESDLVTFEENLPEARVLDDELTDDQFPICRGLLNEQPTPQRVLEYLPRIVSAGLRHSIAAHEDGHDFSEKFDEWVPKWLILKLHPVLRDEMAPGQRRDLMDRLERLKKQALLQVTQKIEPEKNSDEEQRQFCDLKEQIREKIATLTDAVDVEPEQQRWKVIETLEEAKAGLRCLVNAGPTEIDHNDVRRLARDLSAEDTAKFLEVVRNYPELMRNPEAAGELILHIDESSMNEKKGLELTEMLLDQAQSTAMQATDEPFDTTCRNELIAELVDVACFVRRTSLRRALRSRVETLYMLAPPEHAMK